MSEKKLKFKPYSELNKQEKQVVEDHIEKYIQDLLNKNLFIVTEQTFLLKRIK